MYVCMYACTCVCVCMYVSPHVRNIIKLMYTHPVRSNIITYPALCLPKYVSLHYFTIKCVLLDPIAPPLYRESYDHHEIGSGVEIYELMTI